ncbi:WD repeat-containing protein 89 [Nymphon striatum]|nr:WD repeat-containing protein 89 [Nymphon striatum]
MEEACQAQEGVKYLNLNDKIGEVSENRSDNLNAQKKNIELDEYRYDFAYCEKDCNFELEIESSIKGKFLTKDILNVTQNIVKKYAHPTTAHKEEIYQLKCLHMWKDEAVVVANGKYGLIWDVDLGKVKAVFDIQEKTDNFLTDIKSHPKHSDLIFVCSTDGFIRDVRKSRILGAYYDCHSDDITQVAFHQKTDKLLLTGSCDSLVNMFDISSRHEHDALRSTYNVESSVYKLHWIGDMHFACITHMSTLQYWATYESEPIYVITREDIARSLNYSSPVQDFVDCFPRTENSKELFLVSCNSFGTVHFSKICKKGTVKVVSVNKGQHKSAVRCAEINYKVGLIMYLDILLYFELTKGYYAKLKMLTWYIFYERLVFTDGSLNQFTNTAGAGIFIQNENIEITVPLPQCSIMEAELIAINRAIQEIKDLSSPVQQKFVILSD